ncbi:MAG: glycerophosphoryl diester phosphodiesterase [Gammaproteobacteria bacterium]|nr:glycerophosphoryl diester phosphodiesterase [Gammaproteobacteria bacterium]MYF38215.1 glycerophosphoryl diester phosphodiesterase [Gammaproteobacteria bacterium]
MTKQFYIIGHRGAPALAPENTLPSFARAIEENVHGIEFDVHKVDRHLVVIHDESVNRTSNGTGSLQDFSFDALRQLDFGDGATIPTLEEVIEATSTSVLINIELKGLDTGSAVAQVLSNYPTHQFMVSSFNWRELDEFSATFGTASNTEIALLSVRLTPRLMESADQMGVNILNVSSKFLQKHRVLAAVNRGFSIYVYTVNSSNRARQLRNIGVSGVFTDNPTKLRDLN